MKKILSFILALLMVVSCASLVFAAEEPAAIAEEETVAAPKAAETEGQFDFAIKFLEQYGIYKGTSATEFVADAESEIQRYQMALFVARISTGWVDDSKWAVYDEWNDGPENRNENRSARNGVGPYFDDLEGTYAEKVYGAISYAAQKGIIEGYGDNKFGPTDGITYQNALTMVVRTLGYKNLPWPWGYIEKAVTLGLTEGIPSTIAYTDVLNRGAVAQIIYNALFAETKEGDTLAARNFNGGLGWATIIITVCGKGQRAQYIINDDTKKYPAYTGPDAGQLIGFNVVKADGTLEDKTYWVKNDESFKLPAHTERFLGHAYKALFTQDADSQFVNMLYFKPLLIDDNNDNYTVWNYGRLQKTEDDEYPIYAYLKNYTLVPEFNKDTYLNKWNSSYGYGEYIVKEGLQGATIKYTTSNHKYGINWITGDIVEKTTKDKADYVVLDTDGKTELYFKTIWKYNDKLGLYFQYVYDKVGTTTELVGIDVLGEDDIKNLIDTNYIEDTKAVSSGFVTLNKDTILWKTAYASLKSFVLNDYDTPDYGIFEEYRLGQYTWDSEMKCTNDDKVGGFVIKNLDGINQRIWEKADDLLDPAIDYKSKNDFPTLKALAAKYNSANSGILETTCGHGTCWFSEDGLSADEIESGDFIIYSFDKPTGELKVVKKIYDISDPKHTDYDFVATGIVRAYNIPAKTVTIGDKQYSFDYPELLGNGLNLKDGDDTWLARAAYTYLFKSLFNQYVKYVICDDRLVYIELKGTSGELIVVDSYAGLSSDGYIVVNGYKTDDLTYSQFRIGSYNGWVKGDYFYYPSNAEVDKAFYRGTIYQIQSYDDGENVYFVNTVALKTKLCYFDREQITPQLKGVLDGYTYSDSFMDYDYDELIEKGIIGKDITGVYIPKAGYKQTIGKDGKKADAEASKSSDKYVLICNPIWSGYYTTKGNDSAVDLAHDLDGVAYSYPGHLAGGDYAPIIVYTGKGGTGWTFTGYKVNNTSANVYINVDFGDVVGFDRDQYDISYVLFLTYDYETARYDGANAGDDWYLLGASTYTARVFDFYTGLVETRIATNKDLKKGYSYPAINGWIVNDVPYDAVRLNDAIPGAYLSGRQFKFGHGTVGDYTILFEKEKTSKKILSKVYGFDFEVKDLTTGTRVFLVTAEAAKLNGIPTTKITEVNQVNADEFKAWVEANHLDTATMYYWYIHTVNGDTVFYIEKAGNAKVTVPFELYTDNLIDVSTTEVPDHCFIDGLLSGEATKIFSEDGSKSGILDATVNALTFSFTGPATHDTHEAIDTNDFHFGHAGPCNQEDWETIVKIGDKTYRLYGSIFQTEYHPEEAFCNFIKSVTLDLSNAYIVDLYTNQHVLTKDFKDAAKFSLPMFEEDGTLIPKITLEITYKDSCGVVYTFVIDVKVAYGAVIDGYQTYDITASFTKASDIDSENGEDYPRDWPVVTTMVPSVIAMAGLRDRADLIAKNILK